jgi:hypothetical protein
MEASMNRLLAFFGLARKRDLDCALLAARLAYEQYDRATRTIEWAVNVVKDDPEYTEHVIERLEVWVLMARQEKEKACAT